MLEKFDLIVIGAGPGGYVAAIRAAQLKLKVAIIEKEDLGGVCLNWGCIPTKALLRSAEIKHLLDNANKYGLKASGIEFDFNQIIERSRKVANQLAGGIKNLLKKHQITVIKGYAKLLSNTKIEITSSDKKQSIEAKDIIIATGARPRTLPNVELDKEIIWTYREALLPNILPKKLLIVGSGAIGIEFACFYHQFGVEVTVIEAADRILTSEDLEISKLARASFEKQGIKIITNAKLEQITKQNNSAMVTFTEQKQNHQLVVDRVILAIGVLGNIENLGLENTKITTNNNSINTDEYLQTAESNIYAIGDVAASPWLAHKASHEGINAVERIAGLAVKPIKRQNIPGCTYSFPQIASLGLGEQAAIAQGYQIKVGRFPFIGNGKATAMGEHEGMIKTIFDQKTGELLGAHLIGAEVTELIQGFVIAKSLEATELDLMHTIFPHPTLSEMMHESVLDAYDQVIHF